MPATSVGRQTGIRTSWRLRGRGLRAERGSLSVGRARFQRRAADLVADTQFLDAIHAADYLPEDRIRAVQGGQIVEANVELTAAGFALWVHVVAQTGCGNSALHVLALDLGWNRVARSARAGTLTVATQRVAALDHEPGLVAVEHRRAGFVEPLLHELLEVRDVLRGVGRVQLDEGSAGAAGAAGLGGVFCSVAATAGSFGFCASSVTSGLSIVSSAIVASSAGGALWTAGASFAAQPIHASRHTTAAAPVATREIVNAMGVLQ